MDFREKYGWAREEELPALEIRTCCVLRDSRMEDAPHIASAVIIRSLRTTVCPADKAYCQKLETET